MIKKSTTVLLSSVLISSSLLSAPVSAEKKNNLKENNTETPVQNVTEYNYEYRGIEFIHPTPLSDEQLKDLYEMVINPSAHLNTLSPNSPGNKLITPYAVQLPPGGSAITSGPYYRTYSNMETRAAITALTFWVGSALSISTAVAASLTAGTFAATEFIVPTYVGTWNYNAYDSYQKRYRLYSTVVRYKYGNYTTPTRVQVQPIT